MDNMLSDTISKLIKNGIYAFSLPAGRPCDGGTCIGAGSCGRTCYAKGGNYVRWNVRKKREDNLRRSKSPTFESEMIAEIKRRGIKRVRIHDSGDFYSLAYVMKWFRIISALPHVRFYAYTKSIRFPWETFPDNFHVIQSFGGRWDSEIDTSRPHARVFASRSDLRRAGYRDGSRSDLMALRGVVRVGLVYHGQKNLREGDWS